MIDNSCMVDLEPSRYKLYELGTSETSKGTTQILWSNIYSQELTYGTIMFSKTQLFLDLRIEQLRSGVYTSIKLKRMDEHWIYKLLLDQCSSIKLFLFQNTPTHTKTHTNFNSLQKQLRVLRQCSKGAMNVDKEIGLGHNVLKQGCKP